MLLMLMGWLRLAVDGWRWVDGVGGCLYPAALATLYQSRCLTLVNCVTDRGGRVPLILIIFSARNRMSSATARHAQQPALPATVNINFKRREPIGSFGYLNPDHPVRSLAPVPQVAAGRYFFRIY
jgi:hypothetical protein